jgi:CheY-like chemotaxis protein
MKKVLLVDDEQHIREDLGNELREIGYAVHTAQKVEEARKIILSEELDYAIIDLKLDYTSEVGGIKVVNFAKRNQPKLKAIILSGYPFEQVNEQLRKKLEEESDPGKILKEIEEDYIYKGGEQNYIDAVLDKLKELEQTKKTKKCFVIMPFSETETCTEDEWTEIFKNVIKPAVEKAGFNYRCERSNLPIGSIIEDILDKLNRSDLVIADLTDRNPNVLYELGVRHTIGGPAIMIAHSKADIPFDLLTYSFIIYGWKTQTERDRFKRRIKNVIAYLEENPHKAVSPVRRYLDPFGEE